MLLADTPLRELLAAFTSSDPTPGGGSASALAGAIGASLLVMVAGLPKTRTGSEERSRGADGRGRGAGRPPPTADERGRRRHGGLRRASWPRTGCRRRPAEEQTARKAAIQRALHGATDVPLGVMRVSATALGQAAVIAAHGHRAAASDVGVAIALLNAALHGARLNVEINLERADRRELQRRGAAREVARLAHDAEQARGRRDRGR